MILSGYLFVIFHSSAHLVRQFAALYSSGSHLTPVTIDLFLFSFSHFYSYLFQL